MPSAETEAVPANEAGPPPARSRQSFGIVLVLLAAVCFGMVPSLARLAYEGGTDVLTLTALRIWFMAAALAILLFLRRQSLMMPPRPRLVSLALGLTLVGTSIGMLGAVRFIPVAMAVLTFYTYPLIVGLVSRITERAALSAWQVGSLVAAFGGLALALSVSFDSLDLRGLALAALASISVAIQILVGGAVTRRAAPILVTFHMTLTGTSRH